MQITRFFTKEEEKERNILEGEFQFRSLREGGSQWNDKKGWIKQSWLGESKPCLADVPITNPYL